MKNYFLLLSLIAVSVGFLGIVVLRSHLDYTKIRRAMEYTILKNNGRFFIKMIEQRYHYDFVAGGQFPSDRVDESENVCPNELQSLWRTEAEWSSLSRKNVSNVYYLCGLAAYERGDWQEAKQAFELASLFSPEWSYFSLELAIFHWEQKHYEEVDAVFVRCFQSFYARNNCQDIYYSLLAADEKYEVGYWKEVLLKKN